MVIVVVMILFGIEYIEILQIHGKASKAIPSYSPLNFWDWLIGV